MSHIDPPWIVEMYTLIKNGNIMPSYFLRLPKQEQIELNKLFKTGEGKRLFMELMHPDVNYSSARNILKKKFNNDLTISYILYYLLNHPDYRRYELNRQISEQVRENAEIEHQNFVNERLIQNRCKNCNRQRFGRFDTCCQACLSGSHTADCDKRNRITTPYYMKKGGKRKGRKTNKKRTRKNKSRKFRK